MKKLLFILAVLFAAFQAKAFEPYEPPQFNPEEWNYLGIGIYSGGIFDYFNTDYMDDLPAKIWENKATPNTYWVEPDGTNKKPFDLPEGSEWFYTVSPFIIYAQNPDKVITSPIYALHPQLFCVYQRVPDILGILEGSEKYYGKMKDGFIDFPAESYVIMNNLLGNPKTNLTGNFAVTLPGDAIPGDVNGDGVVDIADVNAVINVILGSEEASKYDGRADVNADGTIDIADVNAIINIILG
ncbi:MAG: hypothetical protein HUK11_02975 [Muribaculaceae bacterium]|nr:hypothetical protein [Muribaculaceae bacterium]